MGLCLYIGRGDVHVIVYNYSLYHNTIRRTFLVKVIVNKNVLTGPNSRFCFISPINEPYC